MKLKLKSPFSEMYENFISNKDHVDKNKVSVHWDVFQENFENVIINEKFWKNFLRNSLSIGFNDNLMDFGNARFLKESKFINGWNLRKNNDFSELVKEKISDKTLNDKNIKLLNAVFSLCGLEFVINNLQSNVGSPVKTFFKINHKKYSDREYFCNSHDLLDIYHFFIINNHIKNLLDLNSSTLLEIGGGYGGFISKIKKTYKNMRCILIDLPELSAIQTYYLFNEFPDAKFLFANNLNKDKEKIFNKNFDFLILPYWYIEKIPANYINLVINIRSMMEMNKETIDFYFKNIHRIISQDGIFSCFNRYIKRDIILKNYPFDLYWKAIISQRSHFQSRIHQLILQRQERKNPIPISAILKDFPPINL